MTSSSYGVSIAIVSYPGSMQSAVVGLEEMFLLSNVLYQKIEHKQKFKITLLELIDIQGQLSKDDEKKNAYQIVILPPSINGKYYLAADSDLFTWLQRQHAAGSIMASVCAGAFILAAAGLLKQREATTHWNLAQEFAQTHPETLLNINKIVINDGDIVTAGGLMSWVDLGLELVAQNTNANIMRQLGRILVVDTGLREQRYYKRFSPKLDHGDVVILNIQHYIQANYHLHISVSKLAKRCFLGERSFLRHFVQATDIKPIQYLQRLRVQKACELIETSRFTIDSIAYKVGYEDSSAFRKIFLKTIGLTPMEFKKRFVSND